MGVDRRISSMRLTAAALLLLSTAAFAQSADLALTRMEHDRPAELRLFVQNLGPDTARNTVVLIDLPPSVEVDRVYVNLGQCAQTRPMRCTLGDLGSQWTRHMDVLLTLPRVDATHTVTATVSSDTADPRTENNVVTHTFETRETASLFVRVTPGEVRIDPGASAELTVNVSNFEPTAPTDVRVAFEATPGATIEKIVAPESWTCTVQGATAQCRAPGLDPFCRCSGDLKVTLRANADPGGAESLLTVLASSNLPEAYEPNNTMSVPVQVYRHLVVRTADDAGPGSLRAAMEAANGCASAPCKIVFDTLAPMTIVPESPLPVLTADRIVIDGGGKVTLDGRRAHSGLELRAGCEAVVQDLLLGHFGDQALSIATGVCPNRSRIDQRRVSGTFIGVTPDGTPAPNFRGLRLDDAIGVIVRDNVISDNVRSGLWSWNGADLTLTRNRIERNGASGVFLGPAVRLAQLDRNTITGNAEMGVAVARGARDVGVRHNTIRGNGGLGIDWGLDGVSPWRGDDSSTQPNAPLLLSARYDAAIDRTFVTMTLDSCSFHERPFWYLDLYANGEWVGTHELYTDPAGAFEVALRGNHGGKSLTATASRVRVIGWERQDGPATTSEFSNSVRFE